jgi:CspA family cold shock protein
MTTGTVKFFNENKGYGFIAPDGGGNDAFVHISAVERSGMRTLRQDQRVSYDLEEDRRGKMAAVNLKAIAEGAQDEGAGSDDEPADQAREEAEAATLDQVRERCRRSEAAWTLLADKARRSEQLRVEEAERKAAQHQDLVAGK